MTKWIIGYRDFNQSSARLRETIFTLGNGYMATRGAFEDSVASVHYPATYIAGGYNRSQSIIANQQISNEDFVNFPNWLPVTFRIENEWFDITNVEVLDYREFLNLKKGILKRFYKIKDTKDRIFIINSLRFVSQHNPHIGGIRYSIFSENWSGKITVRSSLSGDVINNGVPRYQDLNNRHLKIIQKGIFEHEFLYIQAKTIQSHLEVSEVAKTEIFKNKQKIQSFRIEENNETIHQEFEISLKPYEKIRIRKIVSVYHSKDWGISENLYDALRLIKTNQCFNTLLKQHILVWKSLWYKADVEIDAERDQQKLIRLHIFHTLQSLSKHSIHIDYGTPARGLHGEAYRAHVFWDELFILPFFYLTFPAIARAMLFYRYFRLKAARELAQQNQFEGAMFPWQSASNGEEETQTLHLNPKSGKWDPDYSCYQRHVNLAIVYNIWNYYEVTQDINFLNEYGAEIIFEIAKFINSITSYNFAKNKFEILGVMGPDEYHEQDLSSTQPGLKNNTYTNIMAVWALERALQLEQIVSPSQKDYLFELLSISRSDINRWQLITKNIFIPFHDNVLSQFEGYENLKEFDWHHYKNKYPNFERLDRILKAEGKNPDEFKIAKQPDTLMLFYLLEKKEIERIFKQLGYNFSSLISQRTTQYYLKRTSHGSTLSKITLASMLLNTKPKLSAKLYQQALVSDIEDTQGGTTQEGIHLGVMVSTITFLKQYVAGIQVRNGQLHVNPHLPLWLKRLKFKIFYQDNLYEMEFFSWGCKINLCEQQNKKTDLYIKNKSVKLTLNKCLTFVYDDLSHKTANSLYINHWKGLSNNNQERFLR